VLACLLERLLQKQLTTSASMRDLTLELRLTIAVVLVAASTSGVFAQHDKKTDDGKPTDPDTGESTVEESTIGLLPNPFERRH
jgi:hypothetical protein